MNRHFLLLASLAVLATLVALPASAEGPAVIMPNVTFERQVEFTPHGPVAINVITAPQPVGAYAVVPVVGGGTLVGDKVPLTKLETDASSAATVAGINGDFYSVANGRPTGIFLHNNVLDHWSTSSRSSIGFDSQGLLHVKRIKTDGTWKGTGQRRPLNGMNQTPTAGQVVLFTPAWGATTPVVANASEVVFSPFPASAPNTDLTATVSSVVLTGGGTAIPPGGAVLMAAGKTIASKLLAEAPAGTTVTTRMILPTDWTTVVDAIGGGPALVKNGKAVFRAGENFISGQLSQRDARGGIGQLVDGRIILVAVDGNQPGYSGGMTTYELAQAMVRLGAQNAAAVAYGGAVTAAFDGKLLSRPKTAGGLGIREGLLVQYYGVYALPASVPVVTKATVGSGVTLTYKIVRPSTVTASVISPDGVSHVLDNAAHQPGFYQLTWNTFDQEGTWHWNVHATDDLARQTTGDQTFLYDLTLSGLKVAKIIALKSGVPVSFTLAQPATVTLQIEKLNGAIIATLPPESEPAGAVALKWDATFDGTTKVYTGSYVMRVTATNAVGTMSLTAPFTLR